MSPAGCRGKMARKTSRVAAALAAPASLRSAGLTPRMLPKRKWSRLSRVGSRLRSATPAPKNRMKREPNAASSFTRVRRLTRALAEGGEEAGHQGSGEKGRRAGAKQQPGHGDARQEGVGKGVAHQRQAAEDEDAAEEAPAQAQQQGRDQAVPHEGVPEGIQKDMGHGAGGTDLRFAPRARSARPGTRGRYWPRSGPPRAGRPPPGWSRAGRRG